MLGQHHPGALNANLAQKEKPCPAPQTSGTPLTPARTTPPSPASLPALQRHQQLHSQLGWPAWQRGSQKPAHSHDAVREPWGDKILSFYR